MCSGRFLDSFGYFGIFSRFDSLRKTGTYWLLRFHHLDPSVVVVTGQAQDNMPTAPIQYVRSVRCFVPKSMSNLPIHVPRRIVSLIGDAIGLKIGIFSSENPGFESVIGMVGRGQKEIECNSRG